MTPAGPNRRGPSARRAHRQACARSANSVRCSGLAPKVLKPTRTAVLARGALREQRQRVTGCGRWHVSPPADGRFPALSACKSSSPRGGDALSCRYGAARQSTPKTRASCWSATMLISRPFTSSTACVLKFLGIAIRSQNMPVTSSRPNEIWRSGRLTLRSCHCQSQPHLAALPPRIVTVR
jgi:hypothetical protein